MEESSAIFSTRNSSMELGDSPGNSFEELDFEHSGEATNTPCCGGKLVTGQPKDRLNQIMVYFAVIGFFGKLIIFF